MAAVDILLAFLAFVIDLLLESELFVSFLFEAIIHVYFFCQDCFVIFVVGGIGGLIRLLVVDLWLVAPKATFLFFNAFIFLVVVPAFLAWLFSAPR